METTIFQGGLVLMPDGHFAEKTVVIRGGKIARVSDDAGEYEGKEIRFDGKRLVPGFIDVHIHGGGGGDWMDASRQQFENILQTHARFGTTGMLATTITAPIPDLLNGVGAIAEMIQYTSTRAGSKILGIHLEGPFINPEYKGAHREDWISVPKLEEIEMLLEKAKGHIKWITLAPEMLEPSSLIWPYLSSHNVISAVGHSNATCVQVGQCIHHGLSHVTHLYNAMRPFHHRETGVIGAALTRDELTVELIVDGIHMSKEALQVALLAKAPSKLLLITDAIRATGMPDGEFTSGGLPIRVKDGIATLADGTLAGSTLTMNQAVKNTTLLAEVELGQALQMASAYPAAKLGIADHKGHIAEGYDADLLIIDDNVQVEMTMAAGEIIFAR